MNTSQAHTWQSAGWPWLRLQAFRGVCAAGVAISIHSTAALGELPQYAAAVLGEVPHSGLIGGGLASLAGLAVALTVREAPPAFLNCSYVPRGGAHAQTRQLVPATALLLAIVIAPVLLTKLPAFCDYTNHLARMHIMSVQDNLLETFYRIQWRVIPNLGIELIVPSLARAFGIFAAGKLFVVLYTLLLCAVATWIALRDSRPAFLGLVSLFCVIVLFFVHFMGLAIYGLAIGSYELWRMCSRPQGIRTWLVDAAILVVPFAAAIPLLLLGPQHPIHALPVEWGGFRLRLEGLRDVVQTYFRGPDVAALLIMLAGFLWAVWSRVLDMHPFGWIFLGVMAIVYLIMPNQAMDSYGTVIRFPIAAVFVLAGVLQWELTSARVPAHDRRPSCFPHDLRRRSVPPIRRGENRSGVIVGIGRAREQRPDRGGSRTAQAKMVAGATVPAVPRHH
jgi:hypothetical protein